MLKNQRRRSGGCDPTISSAQIKRAMETMMGTTSNRRSHLQIIADLEAAIQSPREIALLRIRLLQNDEQQQDDNKNFGVLAGRGGGLPCLVVELLCELLDSFLAAIADNESFSNHSSLSSSSCSWHESHAQLLRLIKVHLILTRSDATLGEELGRQGSHALLSKKLILYNVFDGDDEVLQDAIVELQDVACEIASIGPNFPERVLPFSVEELKARLPLVFDIAPIVVVVDVDSDIKNAGTASSSSRILIHQVTSRQSAQEDVGFVMWPSAVVLSRWLASNPTVVCGPQQKQKQRGIIRVLELGAGCGLVGLVAARIQKLHRDDCSISDHHDSNPAGNDSHENSLVVTKDSSSSCVILTDFNKTVLENLKRNAALNDVSEQCQVVGLDFYEQTGNSRAAETTETTMTAASWKDTNGTLHEQVDVVLAADMICKPDDAYAAANAIYDCLRPDGGRAYVVCADARHRFGVDHFEKAIRQQVGLQIVGIVQDVCEMYDGKLLSLVDLKQTSGYVEGMKLKMFTLQKQ